MIIHNFDPVFIDLGFFQIKWYSISYILGIGLGWFSAIKIIKKVKEKYSFSSISVTQFGDLISYIVIGILIGGRLGYVIFYNLEYYSKNPIDILKVWQGGMSFHGGLLGVIVTTFIFSKIIKISFFKISDILACVTPIGLFLGRCSNFINGELFGKATNLPWGIIFPAGGNISRHPSQIYEAILEGIVLLFLINYFALKKKMLLSAGYTSGLFLVLYSVLRVFSEYFREPDKHLGYIFYYFSMGTLLSIVTFFAGLLIIFFNQKNE